MATDNLRRTMSNPADLLGGLFGFLLPLCRVSDFIVEASQAMDVRVMG